MNVSKKYRSTSVCLFLASVLYVSPPALADTIYVNDISGTGARNFSDPAIWPTMVPGMNDFAVIDKGDGIADYVYIDEAVTQVQRFNIGNQNTGGLEIRSGAYVLTNLGTGQSFVGPGQPGFAGTGYLRIKSGAILENSGLIYLGLNPLGVGNVTLEDGGTHIVGGALAIRDGTGTYNMLGGTVEVGGFFQIARNGHGTFIQSGGSVLVTRTATGTFGQGMLMAGGAGSTGLYEISGGSINIAGANEGVTNGSLTGGGAGVFRIVGSAPTVTIASKYDQRQDASFEVVIDAGGISPMNVGTDVSLDGFLGASFTSVPTVGQQFPIMNYGGVLSGAFATFDNLADSPLGPNTVQLSIDYGLGSASSIVLSVTGFASNQPGDFDNDGDVDGMDFVAWQTNFPMASGASLSQGDADGDGDVDGADFVVWQTNFPFTPGPATSPVPEPSAAVLFAASSIALAVIRRRRRVAS